MPFVNIQCFLLLDIPCVKAPVGRQAHRCRFICKQSGKAEVCDHLGAPVAKQQRSPHAAHRIKSADRDLL